jgi:hypothetical protein
VKQEVEYVFNQQLNYQIVDMAGTKL